MIKILFFAKTKELIGEAELSLPLAAFGSDTPTADEIRLGLVERGAGYQQALGSPKLLVAVNQTLVPMSTKVKAGDEVAFFPPVTGG